MVRETPRKENAAREKGERRYEAQNKKEFIVEINMNEVENNRKRISLRHG